MNCKCECEETVYTPPQPCPTQPQMTTCRLKLYTLRCGNWVYTGEMNTNTAPYPNMRILWDNRPYQVEQATLIGSEAICATGSVDKWEVMLIACPSYSTHNGPCMPTSPCTQQQPQEEPGGIYVEDYNHKPNNNTPRPIEIGLGCGPQYSCNGYPY